MFCSIKFWVIKPPPWNCQQHHFGGLKKAAKNWRQNMLRWWSSWMTDCFLLDVFSARFMWWRSTMTLNSNKALLIHDSNTKTMTHQNLRSFSSFHGISRFGLTVSFTELVHQKTNVHHVWPQGSFEAKESFVSLSCVEVWKRNDKRQQHRPQALYDPMWPSILIL